MLFEMNTKCGLLLALALFSSCEKSNESSGHSAEPTKHIASKSARRQEVGHAPKASPSPEELKRVLEPENKKDLYKFTKNNISSVESNGDFTQLLLAAIANLPSGSRADSIDSIVSYWIQKDSEAAIETIKGLSPGKDRQVALGLWLSKCNLSDAVSLAISKEGLYPEEYKAAAESVYWNAVKHPPDEIAKFLNSQTLPAEYMDNISKAFGSASAKKGMSLSSALTTASRNEGQSMIVRGWMGEMAISSPLTAKQEIQKNQDLAEYTPMIVGFCYKQDKASTLQWVNSIEDSQQRSAATAELARVWVEENSDEASKWVASLPSGGIRDKGSLSIVKHLVGVGDKSSALDWANSILDPKVKDSAMAIIRINNP